MRVKEIPTLRDWMTATSAAKALGITRQRVNRMILTGGFDSVCKLEDSRLYLVARHEVERMQKDRAENKAEPQVEHQAVS